MKAVPLAKILARVARTLEERRVELDALDAALGDGDHGTNIARALGALEREATALAALPLADALARMGERLEAEMGGGGGAAYGAVLRGMARAASPGAPSPAAIGAMLQAGIDSLRRSGGLDLGAKTLLDVLAPVADGLLGAAPDEGFEQLSGRLVAVAAHALHHTRDLEAGWSPACARPDRGLEHIDPGACSAALVLGAILDALAEDPDGGRTTQG